VRYVVAVSVALAALVVLAACGPPNVAEGRPIPPKDVVTTPVPSVPSTGTSPSTTPPAGSSGSSGSSSPAGSSSSTGSSTSSTKSGTGGTTSTATSAAAKLYATTCAVCHGAQGQGKVGPALNTSLVTQTFTTQASLAAFIQQNMPLSNPGSLSASQAAELAAYVETLASGK